jgi:hypothetical protein
MKRDRKVYSKAYYQKNRDKIRAQSKAWGEVNREKKMQDSPTLIAVAMKYLSKELIFNHD